MQGRLRSVRLREAALLALLLVAAPNVGRGQPDPDPPPSADKQAAPSTTEPKPKEEKKPAKKPEGDEGDFWSQVPPLRPMSRTGYFLIPPSGLGHYSFLELLLDEPRPNPPKLPFPPSSGDPYAFYDADWRSLVSPVAGTVDPLYPLKRLHPTDNWLLSFGGEERLRYMDENGGYARFTGQVNTYELLRSRVYADLWYLDLFRIYVEMQDSRIANNDLPPLPNDVDHADFLNLFAEAKLFSAGNQPAYVRVGRQEMYFGSQRLISPSDFPNVLRTFQGVRTFWLGKDWNIDAFWVQPVLIRPTNLDPPDHNQNFCGLWTTYRPRKGQYIDLYYLDLDNRNPGVATGRNGILGGYNVSTLGSHYAGDYRGLLWDFEGMYQFGSWSNQVISAGAATTGLGYQFARLPFNPQFWVYNDWASGNQNPTSGDIHGTFNQLFPWGHTYFGYLDLVGRQNIDDVSTQFGFYPAKWIFTTVQYHVFHLDSARDALYNASGTVIRSDPTGQAGTNVGDEIDFTTNFHLSLHQDIFLGYSKLFAGSFIHRTAGPQTGPALFYCQYSFKW